ncbi:MAG: outer membrane beta-barrel protein [Flavisolibacter sp.]|jgi:hypothetical protein|nr:outer membrane beta-barrel protein [Flavisolibacter sp.]
MRRIFLAALFLCTVSCAFAQADTIIRKANPAAVPRVGGNDHFLMQFGLTQWAGKPDSINTRGASRSFNMYFMFNFPFRTNPQWSVAIGPGLATDHIFFDNTYVGIKDETTTLQFRDVTDTSHFKKYKLATAYLEAPVELRFTLNPEKTRSVKIAVGAKVGTLLSAWVKGKNLVDRNGNSISEYISKEKSKRFFNTNRLSVMGRIGYGNFSGFVSYAINPLLKEGVGPTLRPLTIGITLSGL